MNRAEIEAFAAQLVAGEVSPSEFAAALARNERDQRAEAPGQSAELGEAMIDLDRNRRCGFPEVIFGEGKSIAVLQKIVDRLQAEKVRVLATRIASDKATVLLERFPQARYNAAARTFRLEVEPDRPRKLIGRVAVVTAGTSDLPVAEEVRETLDWMGVATTFVVDVGVAGPHRLPSQLSKIQGSDAVVVVAGMEAALPSVVGGYVDCPVIGVPTNVGYGASLGGIAALLGMLNSCAANVTVVNIDAGFKGGYVAGLIAVGRHKETK